MPIGLQLCFTCHFPLNLAAHKSHRRSRLAAVVMKRQADAARGYHAGEVLAETDLPKGVFSILPAHREARTCSPPTSGSSIERTVPLPSAGT